MNIKKAPFLIFYLLFLINHGIFAIDPLRCELNAAPNGTKFTKENQKDFYKKFNYLPSEKSGKVISIKDIEAKIWLKNKVIHLELKLKNTAPEVKSLASYTEDSKSMFLRMNGYIDLSCSAVTKKQKLVEKLEKSKFKNLAHQIKIVMGKTVVFPLDQPEEQDGMRVVYYQKGKQYFSYNFLNQKAAWCAFRIQTKVRKTIVFYAKDEFYPTTFMLEKNDRNFDNYNYGFIDKDGKLTGSTESYSPFVFNCKYYNGLEMTQDKFKQIVGEQVLISPRK